MRSRLRFVSMVCALLLIAAACGGDEASTTTTTQPDDGDTTTTQADTDDTTTTEAPEEPSGDPIVVGGTMALTGAFAATGIIHEIAGQMFVDQLNASGGLLGRPVEWLLLDDESDGTQIPTLYEQLISQDGVDLIIGPYATPNILATMPIAERYGFVLPQHTSVLAPLMTYECQFPGWSIGPEPNVFIPNQLADAFDTLDGVETVALVTNESGSVSFVTYGRADVDEPGAITVFPERGYDVVADISYPPGVGQDWDAIAVLVRDADPDAVVMMSLGVEANNLIDAMTALNYSPPTFFALFPAPGPLLGLGDDSEGVLSVSIFEPNEPILERYGPEVRALTEEFATRATAAGVFPVFETQAAASWNAWEILQQGVEGAGSLDHDEICAYLQANGATLTFGGHQMFEAADFNFWPSNQLLKQIQNGEWVVVWPPSEAVADLTGP